MSSLPPRRPGGGAPSFAPGGLAPRDAKKFFEFFPVGSHREVLILGDLVEQPAHFVRSKGHKVLCGARNGVCELCERCDVDPDVSVQQVEYLAASMVRAWREREFHQRVAVFSAAAGETVLELIGSGPARGRRLDVERYAQGTSGRFRIKALDGLPAGFPSILPAAFPIAPFVRARFGKQQHAAEPLVLVESFKIEPSTRTGGRPRPLNLSAEDVQLDAETLRKFREYLGKIPAAEPAPPVPNPVVEQPAPAPVVEQPAPAPVVEQPAPVVAPPVELVDLHPQPQPVERPQPQPRPGSTYRPLVVPPAERPDNVDDLGGILGRIPGVTAEAERLALTERVGETVCREQTERSPFLKFPKPGANGHAAAAGKGRGK